MSRSKDLKAAREDRQKAKQASKALQKGRGFGLQQPNRRPQRPQRQRILIVCEGEKTEPQYFKAFPVRHPVDIQGLGANTRSLVDRAVELYHDGDYDETWVVLDRDDFDPEQFRAAIARGRARGFKLAYTNEAFEAWYLMHFHYCDAALSRQTYAGRLTDALGRRYEKNDLSMYATLLPHQTTALQHATRLLETYGEAHDPERDNPCTTVHLLVKRLNALL